MPGTYHRNGGPGPNTPNTLGALERCVERGAAVIAAAKHPDDDRTQPALRTMPLRPFPTQARHSGTGDVNDAASRSYAPNEDMLQVGPNGAQAWLAEAGR